MSDAKNPLVTFALFAYNQEQFIREAVEGAFAQTYVPLEIILSDDFSTDRTFQIMQEMASIYVGPHSVITNRNASNLHVGGHINVVNRLANGELVVAAAGGGGRCRRRACHAWMACGPEMRVTATPARPGAVLLWKIVSPLA